jgi:hypothetical protein
MSLCTGGSFGTARKFIRLPIRSAHSAKAAYFSSNGPVFGAKALRVPLLPGSATKCIHLKESRGYASAPEEFRSALHGPSKRNTQGVCYRVQIWALQQNPGPGPAALTRTPLPATPRALLNPDPQVLDGQDGHPHSHSWMIHAQMPITCRAQHVVIDETKYLAQAYSPQLHTQQQLLCASCSTHAYSFESVLAGATACSLMRCEVCAALQLL